MTCAAIVVAGGTGTRFGGAKQFAALHGRPMVSWSVVACRSVADFVVVVLPDDQLDESFGADAVVAGGSTRSASVRAGLSALPSDVELVIVHDAARPAGDAALFERVLRALEGDDADGVVPGLTVTDTLKSVREVDGTMVVDGTIDRTAVVAVQTPQAFRIGILRRAHESQSDATDDAGLVEAIGGRIVVVPGDPGNLKITTAADLDAAAVLLERR
jgi:2-C-methyl-D-erythritol 4-phosphate cytidylyltransferase